MRLSVVFTAFLAASVVCAFSGDRPVHAQSGPSFSEGISTPSNVFGSSLSRTAADTITLASANAAGETISQLHAFTCDGKPVDTSRLRWKQLEPGYYQVEDTVTAAKEWTFRVGDRGTLYRIQQSHTAVAESRPRSDSDEALLRRARRVPSGAAGVQNLPVLLSSSGYALVLSDAAYTQSVGGMDGTSADVTIHVPAGTFQVAVLTAHTLPVLLQRVQKAVPSDDSPYTWDIEPFAQPDAEDGPGLRSRIFTPELDYALYPYRMSSERQAQAEGVPVFEPIAFDEGTEPAGTWERDQYRFGKALIVAPSVNGTEQKTLVLPSGSWVNFWTGSQLVGNLPIRWQRPNGMPTVWVRGGTVLTSLPVVQDEARLLAGTGPSDNRREFNIFPGLDNEGSSADTDFEGRALTHQHGRLTIHGGTPAAARVRWRFRQPKHVLLNGRLTRVHQDSDGAYVEFAYRDDTVVTWL